MYPAGDLLKVAKANNCIHLICRINKSDGSVIRAGQAGCEYLEIGGVRAAVDHLLSALHPCRKEAAPCTFRNS